MTAAARSGPDQRTAALQELLSGLLGQGVLLQLLQVRSAIGHVSSEVCIHDYPNFEAEMLW